MPEPERRHALSGLRRPALLILAALAGLAACAATATASMVAVGYNGAVLTSDDGVSWIVQPQPTAKSFFGLAQGDQVVAVASDGAAFRSTDAIAWGAMGAVTPQWLMGVATDGATYVAVGTGGAIVSTNGSGLAWTDRLSPTSADLWAVATDGSQWVAVGSGGAVATSNDAVTWTLAPSSGATLRGLAYANGMWVGVGDGVIRTTTDLSTWVTRLATGGITYNAVAFDGSSWVAVGSSGSIRYSNDAITWVLQNPPGGPSYYGVAPPCGGDWTIVGSGGTVISYDLGNPPTPATSGTLENMRGVSCVLTCSPGTQSVLTGSTVSFTVAGGSGTYEWSAADGTTTTGDDVTFSTAFMAAGIYTVQVRDANGWNTRTCTVQVTDPPPTTCDPTHRNIAPGNQVTFVTSNGVPPYTWTAPGTPSPGPLFGPTPTFTVTFPDEGEFTINVHDSGPPVTDAECTVTVRRLSCDPPGREILLGQTATLRAVGGVAPYFWSLPESRPDFAAGPSADADYLETGTYTVTLTDSDDPPKSVTCSVAVKWPPPSQDADIDGIADGSDNCPSIANRNQLDLDQDGFGDACDDDVQQDNTLLAEDGTGRVIGPDADVDGVADAADNCPMLPNPKQDDQDRDGLGDVCDGDLDGDGVAQAVATGLFADNCPTVANARQDDEDMDGFGDACDAAEGRAPAGAIGVADDAQRRSGFTVVDVALVAIPVLAVGVVAIVLWLRARKPRT